MPKRLTLLLVMLLAALAGSAQIYPVQGSLAIASPYSCNLSDYANANLQNLALNLTLADVTVANKRVRLKLFIQTQNAIIVQSADNVQGEPVIILDGGISQRLTNTELAPYFRLENLQGMVPDTYARSLPEGVYTISFEVYDYFTGNRLSGRIGQTFWLIINDPPLLNTPADKLKIADFAAPSGSGGIVFNWTPRSTQVSNTEYELTLCELWDPQGDPYQQFLAAIPKYKTTISNATTFIYTLADPPLQSGYWYAWRVRAKAKAGFEDVGLYRNDGYSNIYTFRYGDPCPAPQNLKAEVKSHDQINLSWDAPANSSGINSYKVAYRKYNLAGSNNWVETDANNAFCNLTNLEPTTEYEFKVGVACSASPLSSGEGAGGEVIYTASQRATTLAAGQIKGIECGKEEHFDRSNQTLAEQLIVGDVVTASSFPLTILEISGDKNGWNGTGYIRMSLLGDSKLKVKFTGLKVNTDNLVIGGKWKSTSTSSGKGISDANEQEELFNHITASVDKLQELANNNNLTKSILDSMGVIIKKQIETTMSQLTDSAQASLKKALDKTNNLIDEYMDQLATATPVQKATEKVSEIKQEISQAQKQSKKKESSYSYSLKLITFITKEEAAANHVYNDYKGIKSYYCKEHAGHPSFTGNKCTHQAHYAEITKVNIAGYGNPTIGIGHLIVGEAELKKWCTKEPLSNNDIKDLLASDLTERELQLNNALPNDIKLTQCQYDALLSIVFNRGIGCESCGKNKSGKGFIGSELYKQLNGDDTGRTFEDLIVNDKSKLANSSRRKNEAELFINCKY